jgi:CheY-like chemotaxis protein
MAAKAKNDYAFLNVLFVGLGQGVPDKMAAYVRNWEAEISACGYCVESQCVASGLAALHAMRQRHFDLVVLSHKLPPLDGLMVLEQMLQLKLNAPVLMIAERVRRFGARLLPREKAETGSLLPAMRDLLMAHHWRRRISVLWPVLRNFKSYQRREQLIRQLDRAATVAMHRPSSEVALQA